MVLAPNDSPRIITQLAAMSPRSPRDVQLNLASGANWITADREVTCRFCIHHKPIRLCSKDAQVLVQPHNKSSQDKLYANNTCGWTIPCRLTKSHRQLEAGQLFAQPGRRLASCQAGRPSGRVRGCSNTPESRPGTGRKRPGCGNAPSLIGIVSLKSSETVTVLTLAPRMWRCVTEMPADCDRSEGHETPTSRSDLQT